MTARQTQTSAFSTVSGGFEGRNGDPKKDLWNTMLDSVASGKRLPEKNLLVIGGSPQSQQEFLDALSKDDRRRGGDAQTARPVANNFALGYTYYDVLDAEHEDILARISLYLLSSPSRSFAPIVEPLITPQTIPHTLIVILLDWAEPHAWLRKLQHWILLLRTVFLSLGPQERDAMEESMVSWRNRGRDGSSVQLDGTVGNVGGDVDDDVRLGPSEWEDALGLPLCVVCQNAGKTALLEKNHGWKESDFDQVLQYIRTVLLRHGASLIYTSPNIPSSLSALIYASLGVTSLSRRSQLKYNVIDRDKILVPPNWDSWGKIRLLREGFDIEAASAGWSEDLHSNPDADDAKTQTPEEAPEPTSTPLSAVKMYESRVPDQLMGTLVLNGDDFDSSRLEVTSAPTQEFLANQLAALEVFIQKAKESAKAASRAENHNSAAGLGPGIDPSISQHIGPVQFNMGGIQVDADDMVQRLRDRQLYSSTPDAAAPFRNAPSPLSDQDIDDASKHLKFFKSLVKHGGGESMASS